MSVSKLGYSSLWIESGLLDFDFIRIQEEHYSASNDESPEHYRWAAFRTILERRRELSPDEFASFVSLAEMEFESVLRITPILALANWAHLDAHQVNSLISRTAVWPESIRASVLARIAKRETTDG